MPAFSGQFDWRAGPIWNVAFASGGIPVEEIRDSDLHVCPALVDTGASATCVSRSVAAALGLEPAGKADMQTAGGAVDVNVYDIKMAFLFGATPDNQNGISVRGDARQSGPGRPAHPVHRRRYSGAGVRSGRQSLQGAYLAGHSPDRGVVPLVRWTLHLRILNSGSGRGTANGFVRSRRRRWRRAGNGRRAC